MKLHLYVFQSFFIFTILICNSLIAQNSVKVEKTMMQLKVESNFLNKLCSLIERERQCNHYKRDLIWSIGITDIKQDNYILNVTMQSEINKDHEYLGYFYLNETLFVISGVLINDLFTCKGKKDIIFNITETKISEIGDYSTWIYLYEQGNLFLKEEYLLPCQ